MQICSGGTYNWPLKGGARLIEVAATEGGTVFSGRISIQSQNTSPDEVQS